MNKEEADLIIAEQNKSKEEILKAVAKVKSDYHELCKLKDMRIAELEHQLTHRNCLDCSNHSSKLRMRTLELEKENAELKEKYVKNITDCDICDTYCNSQLTKAKEIINDCVCELQNILFYKMRNKERIASTLDKAEQFLSEVEK